MNRNVEPATVSWLICLDYFNLISITQSVVDTFALMMRVHIAFGIGCLLDGWKHPNVTLQI